MPNAHNTPVWPGQPCFRGPLKMLSTHRSTERSCKNVKPTCNVEFTAASNPTVMQNSLRLAAWANSDRTYLQKGYQKGLPILSQIIGDPIQSSITSQLGRSSVTGVLNGRHFPLDLMKMTYSTYLKYYLKTVLNKEPLGLTSLQYQLSMTQLGILEWAITPEHMRQLCLTKGFRNQSILLFGM